VCSCETRRQSQDDRPELSTSTGLLRFEEWGFSDLQIIADVADLPSHVHEWMDTVESYVCGPLEATSRTLIDPIVISAAKSAGVYVHLERSAKLNIEGKCNTRGKLDYAFVDAPRDLGKILGIVEAKSTATLELGFFQLYLQLLSQLYPKMQEAVPLADTDVSIAGADTPAVPPAGADGALSVIATWGFLTDGKTFHLCILCSIDVMKIYRVKLDRCDACVFPASFVNGEVGCESTVY
jgi:hypothetical protein